MIKFQLSKMFFFFKTCFLDNFCFRQSNRFFSVVELLTQMARLPGCDSLYVHFLPFSHSQNKTNLNKKVFLNFYSIKTTLEFVKNFTMKICTNRIFSYVSPRLLRSKENTGKYLCFLTARWSKKKAAILHGQGLGTLEP